MVGEGFRTGFQKGQELGREGGQGSFPEGGDGERGETGKADGADVFRERKTGVGGGKAEAETGTHVAGDQFGGTGFQADRPDEVAAAKFSGKKPGQTLVGRQGDEPMLSGRALGQEAGDRSGRCQGRGQQDEGQFGQGPEL